MTSGHPPLVPLDLERIRKEFPVLHQDGQNDQTRLRDQLP